MLDSSDKVRHINNAITFIKIEDKGKAGTYTNVEPDTLSGKDILSVEGVNAVIMHRIATEVPDGKDKVFTAFTRYCWKLFRSLKTITSQLCKKNPDNIAAIAKIIDEQTLGKLSDKEFKEFIGSSDAAREFLKNRGTATKASVEATPGATKASGKPVKFQIKIDGSNPFGLE